VTVARRDSHGVGDVDVGDAAYGHGCEASGRRAIAKLARRVKPPALDAAGGKQRAGVTVARRNSDGVGDAAHRNGREAIGHRAIAELTGSVEVVIPSGSVISPALDATRGEKCACVTAARRDSGGVGDTVHGNGREAMAQRAIGAIETEPLSPALNAARGEKCAGITDVKSLSDFGRRDSDGVGDAAHGNGREAIGPRAIAELAAIVDTPALDAARGEKCAGVIHARHDSGGVGDAAHSDGRESTGPRAIAKLALGVVPPALDAAGRKKCASVPAIRRDSDGVGDAADGHGRAAVGGRAIAELAGVIVSPTLDAARGEKCAGMTAAVRRDGGRSNPFTAVGRINIYVARIANALFAAAHVAVRRRIRERTHVITCAAMLGVVVAIHTSPTTYSQFITAGGRLTYTCSTDFSGAASVAAGATMSTVDLDIAA